MPEDKILKSFVWHKGVCFFASTIDRDTSAMVGSPIPRYHETMAWVYNWNTTKRGKCIAHVGSCEAFAQHFRVCKELFDHGEYKEIGDELLSDVR